MEKGKNDFPIVCCESFIADSGRPTGNGLWEQLSNRPELHM
jgi:hypothetical protein